MALDSVTLDISSDIQVEIKKHVTEETAAIDLYTHTSIPEPLVLHWGVGIRRKNEWQLPHSIEGLVFPPESIVYDDKASETTFENGQIHLDLTKDVKQVNFVIKQGHIWHNNQSLDYRISLMDSGLGVSKLIEEIFDGEQ